jgi:hypothetical protein
MAGSLIGSIAGGSVYRHHAYYTKVAKQGVAIGKGTRHVKYAEANGLATYKGMPGYDMIKSISPKLANRLGWMHNKFYLNSVMRRAGKIHDIGGSATGSYARELKLISKYGNVYRHYLIGFI